MKDKKVDFQLVNPKVGDKSMIEFDDPPPDKIGCVHTHLRTSSPSDADLSGFIDIPV